MSVSKRQLRQSIEEKLLFCLFGGVICGALTILGIALGTTIAIMSASAAWGLFLSLWKMPIFKAGILLALIMMAFFVISTIFEEYRWYEVFMIETVLVIAFLIAYGAGIQLYTMFRPNHNA